MPIRGDSWLNAERGGRIIGVGGKGWQNWIGDDSIRWVVAKWRELVTKCSVAVVSEGRVVVKISLRNLLLLQ